MTTFKENNNYRLHKDLWTELNDLYVGDAATMRSPQYLIPHELELIENDRAKKLRLVREQRSIYTNYVAPFVKRFSSLIFKNPINFENALDIIFQGDEVEFRDIDGYGNSLESFIKNQVAVNYFLFGKVGIYVDSFYAEAQTRLQELEAGIRPFMECWEPLSIIDWKYSDVTAAFNGLDFAVRRYKFIEPRETAKDEERIIDVYRHVYLDPVSGEYRIELLKDSGNGGTASEVITPQPAVEFVPLSIVETESWLKEGSAKAKQIYNLESVQDNILLFQAHQRLFAIGNFADSAGSFAASEGNLVVLRGEGSITAIEPVSTASIEARISALKTSMFQLVFHQTRQVAADSKSVESAETMREAKEEFVHIAKSMANDLQQVVNQALWQYAYFKGDRDLEPEEFITIDSSISEDDVNDFAIWMNTFADRIRRYPAWQKGVDKKAAQLMNLAETDKILEEIEKGEVKQSDPILSLFNGNTERDQGADDSEN